MYVAVGRLMESARYKCTGIRDKVKNCASFVQRALNPAADRRSSRFIMSWWPLNSGTTISFFSSEKKDSLSRTLDIFLNFERRSYFMSSYYDFREASEAHDNVDVCSGKLLLL